MNEEPSPTELCPRCGVHREGAADTASASPVCPQCGAVFLPAEQPTPTESSPDGETGRAGTTTFYPEPETGLEPEPGTVQYGNTAEAGVGGRWLVVGLLVTMLAGVAMRFEVYWNKSRASRTVSAAPTSPPTKRPKSLTDLQVNGISLEETAGSKLLYAVGSLKNDSEHQRFGIKIVLDLFDRDGRRLNTATDYVAVVEPHGTWRFRALVLDPGATTVRMARIAEE